MAIRMGEGEANDAENDGSAADDVAAMVGLVETKPAKAAEEAEDEDIGLGEDDCEEPDKDDSEVSDESADESADAASDADAAAPKTLEEQLEELKAQNAHLVELLSKGGVRPKEKAKKTVGIGSVVGDEDVPLSITPKDIATDLVEELGMSADGAKRLAVYIAEVVQEGAQLARQQAQRSMVPAMHKVLNQQARISRFFTANSNADLRPFIQQVVEHAEEIEREKPELEIEDLLAASAVDIRKELNLRTSTPAQDSKVASRSFPKAGGARGGRPPVRQSAIERGKRTFSEEMEEMKKARY